MRLSVKYLPLLLLAGIAAPAAAQQCRSVTMPDGTSSRMCKEASGRWVPAEAEAPPVPHALPSQAEVTYRGTYRLTQGPRQRQSNRAPSLPRRMDMQNIFNTMNQVSRQAGPQGQLYEGAVTIVVKYDGPAMTANISGTGGLLTLRSSGIVQNGRCRLLDAGGIIVYEGTCSPAAFSGTISGTPTNRNDLSGTFSTQAVSFVNVEQRAATQAAEKAQHDADQAKLKALCEGGKLTACVLLDQ